MLYNYIVITLKELIKMILDIVKIGNSKGIRIPKTILEECGISGQVEVEVKNHNIFIKPLNSRNNWEKEFKKMRSNNDDELIIEDNLDLEESDWEW